MPNVTSRIPNYVDEAMQWAEELTQEAEKTDGNKQRATGKVARHVGMSFSRLRAFLQPSRRPKTVDAREWFGLRAALIAHLRAEAARIDARIEALERMGADEAQLQELHDLAEDFARRIQRVAPAKR